MDMSSSIMKGLDTGHESDLGDYQGTRGRSGRYLLYSTRIEAAGFCSCYYYVSAPYFSSQTLGPRDKPAASRMLTYATSNPYESQFGIPGRSEKDNTSSSRVRPR